MSTLGVLVTRSAGDWLLWAAIASDLFALLTLPSVLLHRQGRAKSALIWVFALAAFPALGALTWWVIGPDRMRRWRQRRRLAEVHVGARGPLRAGGEGLDLIRCLPQTAVRGPFPPAGGNAVELLADPTAYFGAIEALIREAKREIHIEFFEWYRDDLGERYRDLLVARAREGLQVRLLIDGLAGFGALNGPFFAPLRAVGGQVFGFLPPNLLRPAVSLNFRTHRKFVVVDGEIAVTGGANIGLTYATIYQDVGVRLRGPVVSQLGELFADDWYFSTGEDLELPAVAPPVGHATCAVVASGPHMEHNVSHDAFFLAITRAKRRLWVCTPYLLPDLAIRTALATAVFRGVDVRIVAEGKADVRTARLAAWAYYPELVAVGVRLFEYQPKIVHAKVLLVDDDLGMVGSVNVDARSFRLNFESSVFVEDAAFGRQLDAHFRELFVASREIRALDIRQDTLLRRLGASVAQLFTPMM